MKQQKTEIITFKVDPIISDVLKDIPNKSEFIRNAITSALGATCPLCQGSGILTPSQKEHWDEFSAHHRVKKCKDCDQFHLTCDQQKAANRI